MITFNVVSSANNTYKAITNINISRLEYRTFRKGTFGWALDAYVRELPKETKEEALSHAFFTGNDLVTNAPLADNTIIKDKIDIVLLGVNRYNNVKFSEQYAGNDYYEVLGFNIDGETDDFGLTRVTSFIIPIGKWDDPIGCLVSNLYSESFKAYYKDSGAVDGFEQSEQYIGALIKPVRFTITRKKTNFGVIGYVKPSILTDTPETIELTSLAYEWLAANGGKAPHNTRYHTAQEELAATEAADSYIF